MAEWDKGPLVPVMLTTQEPTFEALMSHAEYAMGRPGFSSTAAGLQSTSSPADGRIEEVMATFPVKPFQPATVTCAGYGTFWWVVIFNEGGMLMEKSEGGC